MAVTNGWHGRTVSGAAVLAIPGEGLRGLGQ